MAATDTLTSSPTTGTAASTFSPARAVYTPPECATYAKLAIDEAGKHSHRLVPLDIPEIGDYYGPTMAGQVTAIIAQTSNYKSGFMHMWEDLLAQRLQRDGREDECVVHISVEECIEEITNMSLAREAGEDAAALTRGQVRDRHRLDAALMYIGKIPIYRIGDSLSRPDGYPELSLSEMFESVRYLQDEVLGRPLKIAAIFADYLQAFAIDAANQRWEGATQRRLQVRSDVRNLRRMAKTFACPVIVGVQAKHKLDGAPSPSFQMPSHKDGEESSGIAQVCDRIIQLWMPKMTHPLGSDLQHDGYTFRVDENLIFIKVGKQRGNLPSGRTWKCRIDFQHNRIAPEANEQEEYLRRGGARNYID